jgi:hypothetical protein
VHTEHGETEKPVTLVTGCALSRQGESMAYQGMNQKPPHKMLHGGSARENPVYPVLLSLYFRTDFYAVEG